MQTYLALFLSLFAVAIVVSCRASGRTTDRELHRTWVLVDAPGGTVPSGMDRPVSLTLVDGGIEAGSGRLSGFSGCNRFTGSFALGDDSSFAVGPLALTRMACGGERMTLEQLVTLRIQRASTCSINDGVLRLDGPEGALLFEPEP